MATDLNNTFSNEDRGLDQAIAEVWRKRQRNGPIFLPSLVEKIVARFPDVDPNDIQLEFLARCVSLRKTEYIFQMIKIDEEGCYTIPVPGKID